MRTSRMLVVAWLLVAGSAFAGEPATTDAPCIATIPGGTVGSLGGYCYEELVLNATPDSQGLPLVIALPWMGSTPAEFRQYLSGLQQAARVVLLQGPYPFREGYSFYPVAPRNYYKLGADEQQRVLLQEADRLAAFIDAIARRHPSRTRPVLTGASQGGDLSYVIAMRHPQQVSLSVPLLATMDERIVVAADPASRVPIRVLHGEDDPIVKASDAAHHVAVLEKAGHDVSLQRYPQVGHDISEAMQRDLDAMIDRHLAGCARAYQDP